MTNNEINKYIHEQIMGKCWHEKNVLEPNTCYKCGDVFKIPQIRRGYCSDASPRSLLNEVVEIVESVTGRENEWATNATAEHIARACVAAHQEAGK